MSVAATGFFDGVHRGHRSVVNEVIRLAKEKNLKSQIVTFWPHPRGVLQQEAYNLRLLTSLEEKKELFYSMGISEVTVLEFTKEFSRLTTEEFVKDQHGTGHGLLLHFARIDGNRGNPAAAFPDALGDIVKAHQAAGQHDSVHLAAEHRAHLADALADLVNHGIPDQRRLFVSLLDQRVDRVRIGSAKEADKPAGS